MLSQMSPRRPPATSLQGNGPGEGLCFLPLWGEERGLGQLGSWSEQDTTGHDVGLATGLVATAFVAFCG